MSDENSRDSCGECKEGMLMNYVPATFYSPPEWEETGPCECSAGRHLQRLEAGEVECPACDGIIITDHSTEGLVECRDALRAAGVMNKLTGEGGWWYEEVVDNAIGDIQQELEKRRDQIEVRQGSRGSSESRTGG